MTKGQQLLEALTAMSIAAPKCAKDERHPIITVWSSGSEEQLDAAIATIMRPEIEELEKLRARLRWLHDCSTGTLDSEGYEWGIFRVKWQHGKPIDVRQTLSDFTDLDAEMKKEGS